MTNREYVSPAAVGKFGVARHTTGSAKFKVVRETLADSYEEARRLAVEKIAAGGPELPVCFYIVQIVGRVGIIDGKLEG